MGYFAEQLGVAPHFIPQMSREISWQDVTTIWKLYRLFLREKPDVIHTHTAKAGTVGRVAGFIYRWLTPGVFIGQPRKCKFVHTYHGHIFHSYYGRTKTRLFITIEKLLAAFVTDRVVVISDGKNEVEFWPDAATHALGLRVPKPYADALILDAIRQSHGSALAVSEEEIMAGVREAASFEGLFMAPEGGACVAALRKLRASGHLSADDTVVVFNTGTGLKYTDVMAPLFKR